MTHEIEPPEYRSLLAPNDLQFAVHAAADDRVVLAANGAEASSFKIPAGLSLASGEYYARLSVASASPAAGRTCPRASSRSRSARWSTS